MPLPLLPLLPPPQLSQGGGKRGTVATAFAGRREEGGERESETPPSPPPQNKAKINYLEIEGERERERCFAEEQQQQWRQGDCGDGDDNNDNADAIINFMKKRGRERCCRARRGTLPPWTQQSTIKKGERDGAAP